MAKEGKLFVVMEDDLKRLVVECGSILTKHFCANDLEIASKTSMHDLVTNADKESDAFIRSWITKKYPNAGIITEEDNVVEPKGDEAIWFVADPLDGTANFASYNPHFCVSVGVLDADFQPLVGAVYDPFRDELYSAVKGHGSRMNGKRLRCSQKTEISECLFSTILLAKDEPIKRNTDTAFSMMKQSLGIREEGSSVLDLCWAAAGRNDGYWGCGPLVWDVAAGWLIATEAGCVVSHYDGSPFTKESLCDGGVTVLCANPVIHGKMQAIVNIY